MKVKPAAEKCFVVDSMLGKMAKWLRILGFDTRFEHLTSQRQIEEYQAMGLLVVTRRQCWHELPGVVSVRSNDPMEQLRELAMRISLRPENVRLFSRCIDCNEPLNSLSRPEAFGLVPDYVFETQHTFYRCHICGKIFWPGSHPKRMLARLKDALGWSPGNSDD